MMHPVHVQAHRGASREKTENTLEAFVCAAEMGVNSVELDVHLTQDGVPVVFHDFLLKPEATLNLTSAVSLSELSLTKLSEIKWRDATFKIPTLLEVFGALSSYTPSVLAWVDIEMKTHPQYTKVSYDRFVGQVFEQVVLGWSLDRTVFRSFNWELLKKIRKQLSEATIATVTDETITNYSVAISETEPQWLAPDFHTLNIDNLSGTQRNGVKVMPYTVNRKEDWQKLRDWGIDGITTDDPRGLLQCLSNTTPKFAR
ncbi:MAG: hypothetical protein EB078_01785 [Proteobacteria bacterium]|nr:hypothetical protein [Pseudomonadota bacterium]NDC23366.1 hypothetical protein [Pseudomonadota bacterium]NDD03612.1 hypothetical protein [Pseudomonadota bacterium]